MPSRVIQGNIGKSKSLSNCSLDARWLFVNLITTADDYGRYEADPDLLASYLFPRDPAVTGDIVSGWLWELQIADCNAKDGERGPVLIYHVDGSPYLWLVNWEKLRGKGKRGSKSRWPMPTDLPAWAGVPGDHPDFQGDPREPDRSEGSQGGPPEVTRLRGSGVTGSRGSEEVKEKPQKPPAPGFDSDLPEAVLASHLNASRHRWKKTLKATTPSAELKWVDDMRLFLGDGEKLGENNRTVIHAEQVIGWLFSHYQPNGDGTFDWRTIIASARNFRKHYDALVDLMEKTTNDDGTPRPNGKETDDERIQRLAADYDAKHGEAPSGDLADALFPELQGLGR